MFLWYDSPEPGTQNAHVEYPIIVTTSHLHSFRLCSLPLVSSNSFNMT